MKTNIASIQTVLNILLEKDHTYLIAVDLMKSFNENINKNKQNQELKFDYKSGKKTEFVELNCSPQISFLRIDEISDHDQIVFDTIMNNYINRLCEFFSQFYIECFRFSSCIRFKYVNSYS